MADEFSGWLGGLKVPGDPNGASLETLLEDGEDRVPFPRLVCGSQDLSAIAADFIFARHLESAEDSPQDLLRLVHPEERRTPDPKRCWTFLHGPGDPKARGFARVLDCDPSWRVEISPAQRDYLLAFHSVWREAGRPALHALRRAVHEAMTLDNAILLLRSESPRNSRILLRYIHVRYLAGVTLVPLNQLTSEPIHGGSLLYMEHPEHLPLEEQQRIFSKIEAGISPRQIEGPDAPLLGPERYCPTPERPMAWGEAARRAGVDLVGSSPAFLYALDQLTRFCAAIGKAKSQADRVILLLGGTGTGKEALARLVAALLPGSPPFVALSAAELDPNLAIGTLFGVAAGAATGVKERKGVFEEARGCVLFLDELGHLPPEVGALLLRAIDPGEHCPIGAPRSATRRSELVLVLAGDESLLTALAEGGHPPALINRIGRWRVELPPLNQRLSDIPALLAYFLGDVRVDPKVFPVLRGYGWPGNVRELKQVAQTANLEREARGDPVLTTGHLFAAAPRLWLSRVVIASTLQPNELYARANAPALLHDSRLTRVFEVPEDLSEDAVSQRAAGSEVAYKPGADPEESVAFSFHSALLLIGTRPSIRIFSERGASLRPHLANARESLAQELRWGTVEPDRLLLTSPGGPPLSRIHLLVHWEDECRLQRMPGSDPGTVVYLRSFGSVRALEHMPKLDNPDEIELFSKDPGASAFSYLLRIRREGRRLDVSVSIRRRTGSEPISAWASRSAEEDDEGDVPNELLEFLDACVLAPDAPKRLPECIDRWAEAFQDSVQPRWLQHNLGLSRNSRVRSLVDTIVQIASENVAFLSALLTRLSAAVNAGHAPRRHAAQLTKALHKNHLLPEASHDPQ